MINAQIRNERAAPLWAVLGAPMVGVPLLVVLLAVTAPAQDVPSEEAEGFTTEQVEVPVIDAAVESSNDSLVRPLQKG